LFENSPDLPPASEFRERSRQQKNMRLTWDGIFSSRHPPGRSCHCGEKQSRMEETSQWPYCPRGELGISSSISAHRHVSLNIVVCVLDRFEFVARL